MTDDAASLGSAEGAVRSQSPRWQPLGPIDRRVVGVLVEKAKTVPNAYPMSLNAIVTAANQKNNRDPVMELEPDDVEESLERLRDLGAVGLVQGYGRVDKYRHYLYDWLGVDKVELAVMAELLLRGAQTEGELRAHASRMEPIPDLTALRTILASLEAKRLVRWLTPEGRGRVISHTLYTAKEMEALEERYGRGSVRAAQPAQGESPDRSCCFAEALSAAPVPGSASPVPVSGGSPGGSQASVSIAALQAQLGDVRRELDQLRAELRDLADRLGRTDEDLRRLRRELGS